MVINIAHTKGGVGKSTLATNLAVEMQLPIVDLDMQRSSYFFNQIRKDKIEVIVIQAESDLDVLKKFNGKTNQHIIVDSGGMDNNLHRKALLYSDLIITPLSVSQVEFLGLENFNNLVEQGHLKEKVVVLLNNINPRATKEIAEARQIITEEFGLKIFKSIVGGRKVFKTAFSEGKSVFETNTTKDTKSSIISAQEEVRSLINEIGRILNHGN